MKTEWDGQVTAESGRESQAPSGVTRRHVLRLAALLAGAGICGVLEPCFAQTPAAGAGSSASGPKALSLILSANLEGQLEPCGCPGGPTGGFSRRAALLRGFTERKMALLQLDAGNALLRVALDRSGVTGDRMRHGTKVARIMADAGIQAAAVGPRDLVAVGVEGLLRLSQETRLPWLSANLVDEKGKTVFPPSVILRAGGLSVGVIGVTEPLVRPIEHTRFTFTPTLPAIQTAARAIRGSVDVVILLSSLALEEHSELMGSVGNPKRLAELDLIVTGGLAEDRLIQQGSAAPYLVRVPGEGRQVTRLDLRIYAGNGLSTAALRPLAYSYSLERRLNQLASSERALQDFARQILQEEGKPNPKRLERESVFLKERIATLSQEPLEPPGSRLFAVSSFALDARVGEDAGMLQRVRSPDGKLQPEASIKPKQLRP